MIASSTRRDRLWLDAWKALGSALLALACSTSDEGERCPAQALLPSGQARLVAHWGGASASSSVHSLVEGTACDPFVLGQVEGRADVAGESLEDATFIARLDAHGATRWVQSWPLASVQHSALLPASGGGVWAFGQKMGAADLGDGRLDANIDSGVLARYDANGELQALHAAQEEWVRACASAEAERAGVLIREDGAATRFDVFDAGATRVAQLSLEPMGSDPHVALTPDGGVVVAGWAFPELVLERFDAAGTSLWRARKLGSVPGAVAVLPDGRIAINGYYRSVEDPPPPGGPTLQGQFVELRGADGALLWELSHPLRDAEVGVSASGALVLVGRDDGARELVAQRIELDGSWGWRTPYIPDNSFGRSALGVGQRSLWLGGTTMRELELAGEAVTPLGTADAFLLELAL
jgi:hypothetical protein